MEYLIIGCGLTGAVIARVLAEHGNHVEIWEKRDHIGGNMYDYKDSHGFIVQKYGPHIFHTYRKDLFDFICRFEKWTVQRLVTYASWDGKYTPSPFDFSTIDLFYPQTKAEILKHKLLEAFKPREAAPVFELLHHEDPDIRQYAEFLFKNDYGPYTSKQWGIPVDEIDPSVLARVPVRFLYQKTTFDDTYQVVPGHSFTRFFENLLDHPYIQVRLQMDALQYLEVGDTAIGVEGNREEPVIIYTGALDDLFGHVYGKLPYRSLRFEWKYSESEEGLPAPVVVYPQAKGYTRITDYKSFLLQNGKGYSYAVEYPIPANTQMNAEPYYPVLTEESKALYEKYYQRAKRIKNLIFCGRLGDFKYYNMDQALARALEVADDIIKSSK